MPNELRPAYFPRVHFKQRFDREFIVFGVVIDFAHENDRERERFFFSWDIYVIELEFDLGGRIKSIRFEVPVGQVFN